MNAIVIERVTSDDFADVVPLVAVQLAEHGTPFSADALACAVRGLVEVPGRGAVLRARDGETVVGIAVLAHTWTLEHGGACTWLDELYVVPERRGAGIGAALLREAIRVARLDGCSAIDLEVDVEHARAESLYVRAGFLPRSRRRFWRTL